MTTARFISFEGIDGCGKSTQARMLAERLRAAGREVVLTREPGGAPGAEEIRALVLTGDPGRWSAETETALFTAARRDHLEKTIRPALERGATVVTDRFADSTRVYQGATRGDLRGLVDRLHDALIGVEPDVTLVLDMEPAEGLFRSLEHADHARQEVIAGLLMQNDDERRTQLLGKLLVQTAGKEAEEIRFESFGLFFQQSIRKGFRALAAEFPNRCRLIDAAGTPDELAARIDRALGL